MCEHGVSIEHCPECHFEALKAAQDMMQSRINNQRQTLQNAIDNVNEGRFSFMSGNGFFKRFITRVKGCFDHDELKTLLDEADKEMFKPFAQKKQSVKRKKILGIF
jgi:hypothetical protein